MSKKTIVVLGAGKGCGNHVAEKFANNGFRVILMARSQEHLAEYEEEFKDKGIEVCTKAVDASKPYSITKAFDEIKVELGIPDVPFYNVRVTEADADLKEAKNGNRLMKRYLLNVGGAYHATQQMLGEEFSQKKAALQIMCLALYKKLKEQNMYIGILTVTGAIKPGEKYDLALLAEDFWKLYTERKEYGMVH